MAFNLSFSAQNAEVSQLQLEAGEMLFVLGATGSGKSCLMFHFAQQNGDRTRKLAAHRQTWMKSDASDIAPAAKVQTEQHIQNEDRLHQSRYRDSFAAQRASITIYALIDAENVRARRIAGNASLLKEALDEVAADADKHDGRSAVLLLGRYRHIRPLNLSDLARRYPGLRLSSMTVHGSKGLKADYVVALGLCTGSYGFPSEITDDPLLDLVLAAPEGHPNVEERRLFYVAITRAKRRVFLVADGEPTSPFVKELIDNKYDVTVFGQQPSSDAPCPKCVNGRLQQRENARAGF